MKVWFSPLDLCLLQSYKRFREKLHADVPDSRARRLYRLLAPLSVQLACQHADATEVLLDVDPQVYQLLFALGACRSVDEEGGVAPLLGHDGTPRCAFGTEGNSWTYWGKKNQLTRSIAFLRMTYDKAVASLEDSLRQQISENTSSMYSKRTAVWKAFLAEVSEQMKLADLNSSTRTWRNSRRAVVESKGRHLIVSGEIREKEEQLGRLGFRFAKLGEHEDKTALDLAIDFNENSPATYTGHNGYRLTADAEEARTNSSHFTPAAPAVSLSYHQSGYKGLTNRGAQRAVATFRPTASPAAPPPRGGRSLTSFPAAQGGTAPAAPLVQHGGISLPGATIYMSHAQTTSATPAAAPPAGVAQGRRRPPAGPYHQAQTQPPGPAVYGGETYSGKGYPARNDAPKGNGKGHWKGGPSYSDGWRGWSPQPNDAYLNSDNDYLSLRGSPDVGEEPQSLKTNHAYRNSENNYWSDVGGEHHAAPGGFAGGDFGLTGPFGGVQGGAANSPNTEDLPTMYNMLLRGGFSSHQAQHIINTVLDNGQSEPLEHAHVKAKSLEQNDKHANGTERGLQMQVREHAITKAEEARRQNQHKMREAETKQMAAMGRYQNASKTEKAYLYDAKALSERLERVKQLVDNKPQPTEIEILEKEKRELETKLKDSSTVARQHHEETERAKQELDKAEAALSAERRAAAQMRETYEDLVKAKSADETTYERAAAKVNLTK
jgi:hypothetical protein